MRDVPSGAVDVFDEAALCAHAASLGEARVRELAAWASQRGQPLLRALIDRAGVDEASLLAGLGELLEIPVLVDPQAAEPQPAALEAVSPALASSYRVMPLAVVSGRLRLAVADPFDWRTWDELGQLLRRPLEKILAPGPAIDRLLKASYGLGAETVHRMLAGRQGDESSRAGRVGDDLSESEAANEPTVVHLVNQILSEAISAGATDVHFEPYQTHCRVRYRVDGMLEDVSLPGDVNLLAPALVSRIKIMADLDITEKRLAQDGRCTVTFDGAEFDLRVSILPGVFGEGVVLRLQSRQMVRLDLDALGYEPPEKLAIERLVSRPHGLVLVTGPTGSGKTTTLYSCLRRIATAERKIITIEDPVEYWTEGVLQLQVREEIGFTFAHGLRSMLRHDPDVMLVGEIRDAETAEIAIRSALTGHLVFATLHTNDAASAVTRLLDVGVGPFLLAGSVAGILAQRLVRTLCADCREPLERDSLDPAGRALLAEASIPPEASLWTARGCKACRFSGYRGRSAVAEVLPVGGAIRRLIQDRAPAEEIKAAACEAGMRTLRQTAAIALERGRTTPAEVLRVTQEDA